ncbi:hypothetical protein BJ980_000748 [Nocardioides daedukensis]|uniref:DUF4383 domain-containing protein n=1 Tax=Nocardioides daedukensis TaxID=634462 RepID=A0A7Y9UVL5_9ACTN|nr:DUF4383 domain-containing protein [Nocardioides daedukensis]NYG57825.1 hypothetical protein [Nocardioides daedukensis]
MTDNNRIDTGDRGQKVRMAALVVGVVFLAVGVLGFIPGITTDYDTMEFAGHESGAKLIGLFQVSVLHNIVHLLFGVAGLAMARTARGSIAFLIGGGVIYLVLWIYGLVTDKMSEANFVPLNTADDWLHFVLGLGMVGLGVMGQRMLRGPVSGVAGR